MLPGVSREGHYLQEGEPLDTGYIVKYEGGIFVPAVGIYMHLMTARRQAPSKE